MLRTTKAFALALAAALLALASFTSVASATSSFRMSGGSIAAESEGRLTFEAGERNIECLVTMNGSTETAEIAITGGEMGTINEVAIENCVGEGTIERVLIESAWRITSNGQTGSLPNSITAGRFIIRNTKFRFAIFGGFARCLYEGHAGASIAMNNTGERTYTTGRATADPASRYRRISGFGCPTEGRMEGEFNQTQQTITVN